MKLSVISPTLNEAENVPRLVQQLEQALGGIDFEILIVDDDSADLTWSIAKKISSTNPRVRAIRRMRNPGLSVAVIDGFSAATGDVVACIDADLQHDASILPKMLSELLKGADVVVGSRHVDGGSTGQWNLSRRLQTWIAPKMAQFLLGFKLKDPMSGYFLFWGKNFAQVKEQLDAKGFKILLEILARLQGLKIKEVPYTFLPRTHGQSKLSSKVILLYVQQLWGLCSTSRHFSVRFLKSAVVGGIGVFINLAVMALLLRLTKVKVCSASPIASLIANVNNYIMIKVQTYADRSHKEFRRLEGYLSYLLVSAAGLVLTTGSYAALIWSLTRTSLLRGDVPMPVFFIRLCCEFVAVLLAVWFNYKLNEVFVSRSLP